MRRIPSHHLALEQRDDKVVFEVWQHAAHQVNGALLPTVGLRAAGAAATIRRTDATTTVCRASTSVGGRGSRGCNVRCCLHDCSWYILVRTAWEEQREKENL